MSLRSAVVFLLVVLAVVAGQAPAFAGKKDGGGGSTLNERPAGVESSGTYVVRAGTMGSIHDYDPAGNSSRDTLRVNAGTFTFALPGEEQTRTCTVTQDMSQSHETFEWFGDSAEFKVSSLFWCSTTGGDQYTIFYPHCVDVTRTSAAGGPTTFTLEAKETCGASISVKLDGQKKSTRLADNVTAAFRLTATLQ